MAFEAGSFLFYLSFSQALSVSGQEVMGKKLALFWSRFHLTIRKHFCAVGVMEQWYRLPRFVVQSSAKRFSKKHLDIVLENLL